MKLVVYSSLLAFPHGVWRYSMNKILIGTVLAVTSTITLSAQSNSNFDGFYVGASAGYSSLDAQKKTDYIQSSISNPTYNINSDTKSNNASGAISFGYAHQLKSIYMAYELSALFDNHSTKTTYSDPGDLNLIETLKRKYAFGFNIHPGLYLNDKTVVYGKLGISFSEFKYKVNGRAEYAGEPAIAISNAHNKNLFGFTFGAGVLTELSEKYSLKVEAFHTAYQQYKTPTLSTKWNDIMGPREEKVVSRMKPHSMHIAVGLNITL